MALSDWDFEPTHDNTQAGVLTRESLMAAIDTMRIAVVPRPVMVSPGYFRWLRTVWRRATNLDHCVAYMRDIRAGREHRHD